MARPRTPLLSSEKIHGAALDLVDELGDFTIPQLAHRLGVSPSSLYHHVQGRPQIINGMRSIIGAQALAAPDFPPSPAPWEEQAAAWTRNYRRVLSEHAKAVPLLVGEEVTDAPTLEVYERLASVLADAGFDDAQVVLGISLLDVLCLGSSVDTAGPAVAWRTAPDTQPVLHRSLDGCGDALAARSDAAFEAGLSAALAYLAALPRGNIGAAGAGVAEEPA
ncbi:TetR/AcrR family transcriptional regulator [Arthrobacter sp. Sa2CUA1]|uniref:TetR/AcrR family transcriptional regulator n=1 Tax=Arthrobacter gallicola TaxID=2762225 RepID=A0ABR8UW99_9MICC|nr:TetR/AcrR family transcriptional regulator [Arthrobacter gallicola]MBD7996836.1 TetR/AcrR family transcriptional regulator [Arthrobacter gallicola]